MEELMNDLLSNLEESRTLISRALEDWCVDCNEESVEHIHLEHFGIPCKFAQFACSPDEGCSKRHEYAKSEAVLRDVEDLIYKIVGVKRRVA